MIDAKRGWRTGFKLSLFIYAISLPISIVYILFLEDLDDFVEGYWPGGWATYLGYTALVIFIQSLMAGIIAGLLYAVFHERIPGSLSIEKGIILYVCLYILYSVHEYLTINLWGGIIFGLWYLSLVLGFLLACVYGALLGYLWDRTIPTAPPIDPVPPRI